MADVYSNAYIVIAANRSSDTTGGCFHKRAARINAPLHVPIMGNMECVYATPLSPGDHSPPLEFRSEPLSRRGWALQERTMAQRTLHYNHRQIYFECACGIEAEDGYLTMGSREEYESPLCTWYALLEQFTGRELSKATDKLPAMSGWAKKLQKEIDAEYIAGLWSNDMMRGMAWWACDSSERKPEEYTGPSWSWTSYRDVLWERPFSEEFSRVVDWHVDLKELANPFGQVRDAHIRIRGPVVAIKQSSLERYLAEHESGEEMAPNPRGHISETELAEWSTLQFDYESYAKSEEWRNWDLRTILLGRFEGEENYFVHGLVFKEAGCAGSSGKMERVGWIRFTDSRDRQLLAGLSWETVTLI